MSSDPDELKELLIELTDGGLDREQSQRLDEILCSDPAAQDFYEGFLTLHSMLLWQHTPLLPGLERAADQLHGKNLDESCSCVAESPCPVLGFLGGVAHGAVGHFSSSWLVAYLVATVFLGIGLLIGTLVPVSQPVQIATQSTPLPSVVGRITGMADCQWAEPSTATVPGAHVPLGRKYVLSSGLMEITYDTGAKVILQGPVTYEVESAAGGFLSLGKLTAKLGKRVERGEGRVESTKQQAANPQFPIPNPSLSPLHSPLFTIKTPTATVTDLGTEFGVDVDKQGNTTSRVYRGSVRLQVTSRNENAETVARVLHENESARVEKNTSGQGDDLVPVLVTPAKSADFVRELPRDNTKRTIKTFDLVDVVAGGDGFSGRRAGGIDPTTGRATNTPPEIREAQYAGDHKYHPVEALPLVDGVFIPDGPTGSVQVDSDGHTFADFPKTDNTTSGYIWAGGAIPLDNVYPPLTVLNGVDYAQPGHGVLFLHANKGITFDLEAIRKANPNCRLLRFRATAGNTDPASAKGGGGGTDLWVLVDGQVRYRRREINGCSGGFSIAFPIGPSERFLTLVATDSGNGISGDIIMFGDPVLELAGPNIPVHDTK